MTLAISHRSGDDGLPHRRPQLYLVPPLADEAAGRFAAEDGDVAMPAPRGARAQLAARAAVLAARSAESPRVPGGRGARSVRLTRRGRVVFGLALLGFAITLTALLAPASQAASPAGPPRAIVVRSGDTLWSIATAAMPHDDPVAAVNRVRVFNHLPDNRVYVGEQLLLPAS